MKSNDEYFNQSPEHQAKLIASEGDYDYEHALRWVLGGVALYGIRKVQEPVGTRECEAYTVSGPRSRNGIGTNGNARATETAQRH